jgi:hypothetical protein
VKKDAILTRIEAGNQTLLVRNRYASAKFQRLLVMAGIVAVLAVACLFAGGKIPIDPSSLRELPYLLLLVAVLWGRTRIYVFFSGNQVSNGLLLNRNLFLFSRSWSLSEFESITLDLESRMYEFEFAGKKWYDPRLLLSVRKDSHDLRSIVNYLSQKVDAERLDSNIQQMIATGGIAGAGPKQA